ncbi:MAG: ABC transporter ATP-binding protein [Bradyrhizobiaceae bacterium]|nr:ABC transporter ATP-binding protein [Bradyrhizobiaceae bacterium]
MSAVLLSVRGLTKSYGVVRVLDRVDLDVYGGEVLGILGPNGAGKTTLFNVISGDIRPQAGTVEYSGAALGDEAPFQRARRGIGRTYQIPRPYAAMTTFENLLVAAMFSAGRRERDAYAHCAAILHDCGIAERANLQAGSLTLLDRKRLELARALAGEPKILLLDEIAGGLTDEESRTLVELVRRIRDKGITIVWIEHVLHAIMAVADRVIVLSFGQKIAEGSPSEVMADPEVRRVYMGIEV